MDQNMGQISSIAKRNYVMLGSDPGAASWSGSFLNSGSGMHIAQHWFTTYFRVNNNSNRLNLQPSPPLEKFLRISLYVTDNAIAKLHMT